MRERTNEESRLGLYVGGKPDQVVLDASKRPPGYLWSIGRESINNIQLAFPMVSARHARIRFEAVAGCWELLDSNSTNGTLKNGRPMQPFNWIPILEGDLVIFGDARARIRFTYEIDETLRKRHQAQPRTQARLEPLSMEDWQAWQASAEEADGYKGTLREFFEWVATPTTLLGALYRLVVLLLVVVALALAVI